MQVKALNYKSTIIDVDTNEVWVCNYELPVDQKKDLKFIIEPMLATQFIDAVHRAQEIFNGRNIKIETYFQSSLHAS